MDYHLKSVFLVTEENNIDLKGDVGSRQQCGGGEVGSVFYLEWDFRIRAGDSVDFLEG